MPRVIAAIVVGVLAGLGNPCLSADDWHASEADYSLAHGNDPSFKHRLLELARNGRGNYEVGELLSHYPDPNIPVVIRALFDSSSSDRERASLAQVVCKLRCEELIPLLDRALECRDPEAAWVAICASARANRPRGSAMALALLTVIDSPCPKESRNLALMALRALPATQWPDPETLQHLQSAWRRLDGESMEDEFRAGVLDALYGVGGCLEVEELDVLILNGFVSYDALSASLVSQVAFNAIIVHAAPEHEGLLRRFVPISEVALEEHKKRLEAASDGVARRIGVSIISDYRELNCRVAEALTRLARQRSAGAAVSLHGGESNRGDVLPSESHVPDAAYSAASTRSGAPLPNAPRTRAEPSSDGSIYCTPGSTSSGFMDLVLMALAATLGATGALWGVRRVRR